jgi:tetratricopeptide (TPR) repeat protein
VDILNDIAYLHYFQDRRDAAETVLRRALRIQPNDPAICSNLGMLLGEQGRDRQALMTFRRSGTDAEAHANMGFVYVQRGDFERARESYRRALSLDRNLRPAAEALEQLAQYESMAAHVPSEGRVLASRWQLTTTVAPVLGTDRQFVPWEVGPWDGSQGAYPVQTVSYDQPVPAVEGGQQETEPRVPNRPSRFWLRLAGVIVE